MHTVKHHSAIKKNEVLPPAPTWMDLGVLCCMELDRQTNAAQFHLCVESKNQNEQNRHKLVGTEDILMVSRWGEVGRWVKRGQG